MISKFIFLFLVLFNLGSVYAAQTNDLYKEQTVLPSAMAEQSLLEDAFSESVEKVLVRVSGRADRIKGDVLAQAKKNAPAWVSQHSIVDLGELKLFGDERLPAKQVTVSFYPQSIDRFLSENALPVWGSNRPSVLLWLVEDHAGVRSMSGALSPSDLLRAVSLQAKEAGLAIYAPLLDDVDKAALTTGEAWGLFEDAIRSASKRYETDTVLVVRVSEFAGKVSAQANLLLPDTQSESLPLSSAEAEGVAVDVVSKLAKSFSDRYASIQGVDANSIALLDVDGIKTFEAVKQVERYLNSIGVVNGAQVSAVDGARVSFKVKVNGSKQKLRDSISLGHVISRLDVGALEPGANTIEFYKFNGVNK
ncbi:DUF2066 domain-containing protein [Marinomonas mediterranea]|uniref:DUF2066 domain-containing protein n=1 Tax=Marinomonas mediterranea TaxID=119864 RepID=UPI002349E3EF|nr:DUF2066 domain-containing protein [Marinomonas mediterranea]WCN12859.1 DUF2066 domain-containing protein [Marinomonas mediterranea]